MRIFSSLLIEFLEHFSIEFFRKKREKGKYTATSDIFDRSWFRVEPVLIKLQSDSSPDARNHARKTIKYMQANNFQHIEQLLAKLDSRARKTIDQSETLAAGTKKAPPPKLPPARSSRAPSIAKDITMVPPRVIPNRQSSVERFGFNQSLRRQTCIAPTSQIEEEPSQNQFRRKW